MGLKFPISSYSSTVSLRHVRKTVKSRDEESDKLFKRIVKPQLGYHDERWFPIEEHFPVLLLSFVGPQHGWMLYACMDKEQIIRQPRLYIIEREDNALLDLFARSLGLPI